MRQRLLLLGLCLFALGLMPPVASAQDAGGRVCVSAFHDANQNGVRDPIEPLLADVVVYLLNAQTVVTDSYLTTGQAEPYCFAGLAPGEYSVNFNGASYTPTGLSVFSVTLSAGQIVPPQVEFGALPTSTVAPQADASATTPAIDPLALRLVLACLGAIMAMLLVGGLGIIVSWVRFRPST